MRRTLPRIGILHDRSSHSIAETYLTLLSRSAYAECQSEVNVYDLNHPEQMAKKMDKVDVMFVHVGIPGRDDYAKQLHGFLDIYARVLSKPAIGLITHDTEHTRYIIDKWLNENEKNSARLPDGALNIIDASRPLRPKSIDKAMQILLRNSPGFLVRSGIKNPRTRVTVDSLLFSGDDTTYERES